MLTATTQDLWRTQVQLNGLRIGYLETAPRRCKPGEFNADEHRRIAMRMRLTEFEEWRLQQFLPTEAPNDPQPAMPGAA